MSKARQWHYKGNSLPQRFQSCITNCFKSLSKCKCQVVIPSLDTKHPLSIYIVKKISKIISQVSSYFKTHQGCMYFPKYPLLFQWPREFTGEKMLQSAKKKICVPLCPSCFTNNKNIFCQ